MLYDTHWLGFGGGGIWLFWILLLAVAVWVIRIATANGNDMNNGKTALDILKERYARGEIDQDEFEQKQRDLGG